MRYGIYIGKDSELGLTASAAILFVRDKQKNRLESRLYTQKQGRFSCVGVCRSYPALTELHQPARSIKTIFLDCDQIRGSDLSMKPLIGSGLQIDSIQDELWVTLDCERIGPLSLHEVIDQDPQPGHLPAQPDRLGECLRQWNRGVHWETIEIEGERHEIGCQINTDLHMLIFEISPRSVYCRAARFAAVNEGIVFDQNIRLGPASFMAEDNREAAEPLPVSPHFFESKTCFWTGRTVVWSVAAYTADQIELHGCQGAVYCWRRPA